MIPDMSTDFQERAEDLVRQTGERATPGRIRVLAMLLSEQRPVSHQEIEERLRGKSRLNRVTLYRILDWLNDKCLVHRVVSDDRIWRFRANNDLYPHRHAHFKCTRCTRVMCLDDTKAEYDRPLPAGYRPLEIELTVKGLCAECA